MKRRDFVKLGLATTALPLILPSALGADEGDNSNDDYKAIIVLYLNGGNDGVNTFIPSASGDDEYGYNAYQKSRSGLAVANIDLTEKLSASVQDDDKVLFGTGDGNIYINEDNRIKDYTSSGFYIHDKGYSGELNFGGQIATHAFMPELAHYVNRGQVAIIQNVGNLVEPTTRQAIHDKKAILPLFLMAHDHQGTITATSNGRDLREMGLFGRLADEWQAMNSDSVYGMNVSLTSNRPRLLYGYNTVPSIFSRQGIKKMITALNDWSYYRLYKMTEYERSDPYKRYFNKIHRHSIELVDIVTKDWDAYDSIFEGIIDSYGNQIAVGNKTDDDIAGFAHAGVGDWEDYLLNAAKLIQIGSDKGLKRQVFYVSLSFAGFDTHAEQSRVHGINLRRISLAVDKLQRVLEARGMSEKVTTVITSEFGRSVGANGDGSDHAWGSNLFAIGGAVKGGLYGKRPSMVLGGEDDMNNKGRLIPTTSMNQFYNTLLEWFGADEALRLKLLPELQNFDRDSWNIGFMA
jgi:uncharacterized protein (DUF1501 family)